MSDIGMYVTGFNYAWRVNGMIPMAHFTSCNDLFQLINISHGVIPSSAVETDVKNFKNTFVANELN